MGSHTLPLTHKHTHYCGIGLHMSVSVSFIRYYKHFILNRVNVLNYKFIHTHPSLTAGFRYSECILTFDAKINSLHKSLLFLCLHDNKLLCLATRHFWQRWEDQVDWLAFWLLKSDWFWLLSVDCLVFWLVRADWLVSGALIGCWWCSIWTHSGAPSSVWQHQKVVLLIPSSVDMMLLSAAVLLMFCRLLIVCLCLCVCVRISRYRQSSCL